MEATMSQTTIGEVIANYFYGINGDEAMQMSIETYQTYSAIADDVLVEQQDKAMEEYEILRAMQLVNSLNI